MGKKPEPLNILAVQPPVLEPSREELAARALTMKRLDESIAAAGERAEELTRDANDLRRRRDQPLSPEDRIPQSPKIQAFITKRYNQEAEEILRKLQQPPEEV
jgi:hypothetical protein